VLSLFSALLATLTPLPVLGLVGAGDGMDTEMRSFVSAVMVVEVLAAAVPTSSLGEVASTTPLVLLLVVCADVAAEEVVAARRD